MLIIQAGTPDMADMMNETRRRCVKWGYRYSRHPLEKSTDLEGDLPPCTFKPRVVAEAIQQAEEDELCAWLDADAIPRYSFDPLHSKEFDVAVTLRAPAEVGVSRAESAFLNAGVIFFRANKYAKEFIARWRIQAERMGNDQWALSDMVGGWMSIDEWKQTYNKTIWSEAARVHILHATEWNYFDFNRQPPPSARILHFKRGWRALNGPEWWKQVAAVQ